ncbi:hypothetical protein GUJ93_ZPchr0006g42087 [Zizania palustris]|uniref:Uncharacterized protein n=1 Tax=Zizania palustris TaxID=103762 RepID=A0A8J5SG37_ZIZPA|nr:hypothetical protein GUJ93_ZPchr0006g42087 [Zizania palustris]
MSPSSSSTSAGGSALVGSHAGLALAATAMALSGTLVLFSLCRAKPRHDDDDDDHLVSSSAADAPSQSPARLRPCLSSSEKRKREKARRRSNKKRVRFADDVVDNDASSSRPPPEKPCCRNYAAALATTATAATATPMPANREALYRGMLRGRSMLRVSRENVVCRYYMVWIERCKDLRSVWRKAPSCAELTSEVFFSTSDSTEG